MSFNHYFRPINYDTCLVRALRLEKLVMKGDVLDSHIEAIRAVLVADLDIDLGGTMSRLRSSLYCGSNDTVEVILDEQS